MSERTHSREDDVMARLFDVARNRAGGTARFPLPPLRPYMLRSKTGFSQRSHNAAWPTSTRAKRPMTLYAAEIWPLKHMSGAVGQ